MNPGNMPGMPQQRHVGMTPQQQQAMMQQQQQQQQAVRMNNAAQGRITVEVYIQRRLQEQPPIMGGWQSVAPLKLRYTSVVKM